ncbi:MAG: CHAD domain-containing protein [Candidatus Limnocylindrales bacterium]|jgi:CHAD domain-containing protein
MATSRKIEVETKFQVATPGGADRYLVAPELGPFTPDGPVRSERVEDRYVDSSDWALARAGFAGRLRRTSRGTEIGLKALNVSSGRLQRREEIEGQADARLIPADWPASQARSVVLELCGDAALIELLTIRQLRRIRPLRAGDTLVELSLDEVEVVGEGNVLDTFEEFEVELKQGDEAPLAALAEILEGDTGLRRVSRSKLAKGIKVIRAAMTSMPQELQQRWLAAPPALLAGKSGARRRAERADEVRGNDAAGSLGPMDEPAEAPDATAEAQDEALAEAAADATQAPTEPARVKPGPRTIGIVADDSMPEAACKVLRFHFSRMQRREAGTRTGSDTEDLHEMRVSTRRMRAAWRVFDGAFKAGKTRKMRRHLETIADRLGTVRDLDVLIEGLEAYRSGLDEDQRPGLDPLLSLWRRQRAAARTLLIGELDSDRYASFVKEMEAFLEAGSNAAAAVAKPTSPHRVRDRVASELWASYEAVRAYELVYEWADVETLHELRIASKWLRYTLEFFGETLGPDCPRLLQRVVALQDHLGCLHDADVATKLARDLLVARAGELSKTETEVIGAYLHSREREVARRRRTLGPIWRAVNGAPFRRGLGRATAAL